MKIISFPLLDRFGGEEIIKKQKDTLSSAYHFGKLLQISVRNWNKKNEDREKKWILRFRINELRNLRWSLARKNLYDMRLRS